MKKLKSTHTQPAKELSTFSVYPGLARNIYQKCLHNNRLHI